MYMTHVQWEGVSYWNFIRVYDYNGDSAIGEYTTSIITVSLSIINISSLCMDNP